MRIANRDAKLRTVHFEVFKANNIFSEWINGKYVVYSYGHHYPMFVYTNDKWYENSDRYSVTTSKHHSQARPLGVETIPATTGELKGILCTP
jgi:hypothetical protein